MNFAAAAAFWSSSFFFFSSSFRRFSSSLAFFFSSFLASLDALGQVQGEGAAKSVFLPRALRDPASGCTTTWKPIGLHPLWGSAHSRPGV